MFSTGQAAWRIAGTDQAILKAATQRAQGLPVNLDEDVVNQEIACIMAAP